MAKKSNWGGTRKGAGRKRSALTLSPNEALLIIDALNGTIIEPSLAEQLIPFEIQDAITLDHLDQKWEIDGKELVAKLSNLTHDAALDLLERVNQFWSDSYHIADARKRVKEIGMVREDAKHENE